MTQGATIQVHHPVVEQAWQGQLGIAPGGVGAGHADAVDGDAGVRRLEPCDHQARLFQRGGPKPRFCHDLCARGWGGGHQKTHGWFMTNTQARSAPQDIALGLLIASVKFVQPKSIQWLREPEQKGFEK